MIMPGCEANERYHKVGSGHISKKGYSLILRYQFSQCSTPRVHRRRVCDARILPDQYRAAYSGSRADVPYGMQVSAVLQTTTT